MPANIINFPAITQSCGDCDWSDCCVTRGLLTSRTAPVDQDAGRTFAYRANDQLFLQGDTLENLYFLRSGSLKSVVATPGGEEQIVAFHFPGDLIGFDGMLSGRHQATTVALETSGVCRIALQRLKAESTRDAILWDELMRSIAGDVSERQNHSLMLAQKSVHSRFASFLCYLSGKYASRGYAGDEFNLTMSRQEIANYLCMAVETLSRLITDFQRRDVIEVDRRFVRITDVRRLKALSQDAPCDRKSAG